MNKFFATALLLGALGFSAVPANAAAVNYLPATRTSITYNADIEGSSYRPIVGALMTGTMRITVDPSGIISGTYVTTDGRLLPVNGGLQPNGNVWLDVGPTRVSGQWQQDGSILGYTYGPPALNWLKFSATAVKIQH
jgi:hypothetical protein